MAVSVAVPILLLVILGAMPWVLLRLDGQADRRKQICAAAATGLLSIVFAGFVAVTFFDPAGFDFRMPRVDPASVQALVTVVKVAHWLGSTKLIGTLTVLMAVYLWRSGRGRQGAALVGAFVAERGTLSVLKHSVGRLRPEGNFEGVLGLSFPSGHASGVVLVYGIMLLLIAERKGLEKLKAPLTLAYVAWVLMMGASRILGRAHWGIDVLSGFSLGGYWLAMTILVWNGSWCGSERRRVPDDEEEAARVSAR